MTFSGMFFVAFFIASFVYGQSENDFPSECAQSCDPNVDFFQVYCCTSNLDYFVNECVYTTKRQSSEGITDGYYCDHGCIQVLDAGSHCAEKCEVGAVRSVCTSSSTDVRTCCENEVVKCSGERGTIWEIVETCEVGCENGVCTDSKEDECVCESESPLCCKKDGETLHLKCIQSKTDASTFEVAGVHECPTSECYAEKGCVGGEKESVCKVGESCYPEGVYCCEDGLGIVTCGAEEDDEVVKKRRQSEDVEEYIITKFEGCEHGCALNFDEYEKEKEVIKKRRRRQKEDMKFLPVCGDKDWWRDKKKDDDDGTNLGNLSPEAVAGVVVGSTVGGIAMTVMTIAAVFGVGIFVVFLVIRCRRKRKKVEHVELEDEEDEEEDDEKAQNEKLV